MSSVHRGHTQPSWLFLNPETCGGQGWCHLAGTAFCIFVEFDVVLRTSDSVSYNISRSVESTCWWFLWLSREPRCTNGLPDMFINGQLLNETIVVNSPTAWLGCRVGRLHCSIWFVATTVTRASGFFFSAISTRKAPFPVFMTITFCTGAVSLNTSLGVQFLPGNHVWTEWVTHSLTKSRDNTHGRHSLEIGLTWNPTHVVFVNRLSCSFSYNTYTLDSRKLWRARTRKRQEVTARGTCVPVGLAILYSKTLPTR